MKCPVCPNQSLQPAQLDAGPSAWTCQGCAGHLIKSTDYWTWRGIQPPAPLPRPPAGSLATAAPETWRPRICPQCGHFLGRFRVGGEIAFNIDKCAACGGMWFDRAEWDVLRRHNLHDAVHYIFSDAWQHQLKRQVLAGAHGQRLQEIFGPDDLAELQRIRTWIASHPRAAEIRAFLTDLTEG